MQDDKDKKLPLLPYIEFHVTDHCNLNCKACSHFCPIADEHFLSLNEHLRDMSRLAEIFENIGQIRILGGEPLLHPNVSEFIKTTRQFFPHSYITLVTNGILLPKMEDDFYKTLKTYQVGLDISIYPIAGLKKDALLVKAKEYDISISIREANEFFVSLNPNGDSDIKSTFEHCWLTQCIFLRNGKIYHCAFVGLAGTVNKAFGLVIPDSSIDIHTKTGSEILDFLRQPPTACAFCTGHVYVPWERSKKTLQEWCAVVGRTK
ncbi:radical SAM protein [Heliobacterium chlorum]|uniref:Radical SAM protein n=1 Tax=Heliobacterium chlorum TaxID=2698 RepID=A0ABR7SZ77_HELCL|nr:radical SAM protein [Heliobacterium chlorum]MBC9783736.1 radical SAM protein [Heliobacterium chlorum]